MEKLRRYVESGKFEEDAECGFRFLSWFSWAVIFVALLIFWPAVVYIIWR